MTFYACGIPGIIKMTHEQKVDYRLAMIALLLSAIFLHFKSIP